MGSKAPRRHASSQGVLRGLPDLPEGAGENFLDKLSCELTQDVEAAIERAVVDGVGDAEVGVAAAEDVAGDDQQVVLDRLGDEVGGGRQPAGARGKT